MTDKQLFELCQQYGKEARLARNRFVALLPEVYKRRLYRKKGFGSIFEFAAKLGGVSRGMVEDVIRIDEKLKEMPKLKELLPKVGLSKLRRVANVATKKTQNEWAIKVQKLTKSALETHIRDVQNSWPGPGIPNTIQEVAFDNDHENFSVKLDPRIILKLKIIKNKMGKGTTWNELFQNLTDVPTPRTQKNPRPSNPESRNISTQKRRDLGEKCLKCDKPAVEIHHKQPWAINKSHENLESLCRSHHELEHQAESVIDKKFRKYLLQPALL